MPDKTIYCTVCGRMFTFSAGEQSFYKLHNFPKPKKCKACKTKEHHPYYAGFITDKLGYPKIGIRHGRNGYFNYFNID